MAQKICGIIIGEARSAEEAGKLAETMKNCPYVVASGTTSNKICFVCVVPKDKRWWVEYPETNPKGTGVEKARVYIVENVTHPKQFKLKLPRKKTKTAPCGADCHTCPLKEEYDCSGCPATIYYEGN